MNVKITSTLIHEIRLSYRMPSKPGEKPNPVLKVRLQPRALLQDVQFPSEEFFEEFKKQNATYIESGHIIIGATTAKKAEKANEDNTKLEKAQVFDKINENTNKLEKSAKSARGKMSISVKKDSDN